MRKNTNYTGNYGQSSLNNYNLTANKPQNTGGCCLGWLAWLFVSNLWVIVAVIAIAYALRYYGVF